jgi:hypothetical protein
VSKCGWAHRRQAGCFDTGIQKLILPDMVSASIPAMNTLRSSLSMYIFFSHCLFY